MGSHSFCANLTHFEVGSHSSEAADLDRSVACFDLSLVVGDVTSHVVTWEKL